MAPIPGDPGKAAKETVSGGEEAAGVERMDTAFTSPHNVTRWTHVSCLSVSLFWFSDDEYGHSLLLSLSCADFP